MDEKTFHRQLRMAHIRRERGEQPDYWFGYERGLIRGFRVDQYGTDQEHEFWLSLTAESDASLQARGRGYRHGLFVATVEEAA